MLDIFVGNPDPKDTFMPEDWISSFVEAKNRVYIEGEGISKVLVDGRELPITEIITEEDLGPDRRDSGVLVKYLKSFHLPCKYLISFVLLGKTFLPLPYFLLHKKYTLVLP